MYRKFWVLILFLPCIASAGKLQMYSNTEYAETCKILAYTADVLLKKQVSYKCASSIGITKSGLNKSTDYFLKNKVKYAKHELVLSYDYIYQAYLYNCKGQDTIREISLEMKKIIEQI